MILTFARFAGYGRVLHCLIIASHGKRLLLCNNRLLFGCYLEDTVYCVDTFGTVHETKVYNVVTALVTCIVGQV